MSTDNKNNKPVAVCRSRGIAMSVFENASSGDKGSSFFKVTIQKTYRDKDGEFKTTNSFGQDDLPHIAMLAQRVWQKINDREELADQK